MSYSNEFQKIKKFIIFLLFSIFLFIIDNNKNIYIFNKYILHLNAANKLPFPKKINNSMIFLEKKKFLDAFSKASNKNISRISTIFLNTDARFGNMLIMLFKAIFYCQILNCKIILNKKKCWFIQKKIVDRKNKIFIDSKEEKNIKNSNMLIETNYNLFFYSGVFFPIYRYDLIRKEIINNLPKIKINMDDLYIYIRSGDIFYKFKSSIKNYIQPPLCFYRKALKISRYRKINIIAENTNNPVIKELLKLYPFIKYKKNSLKFDISYLINAYNIIGGGHSTFFGMILAMNLNVRNLWLFILKRNFNKKSFKKIINNYKIKIGDLSHTFKKQIFKMYSSNYYIDRMWPFNNSVIQRNILLNYTCPNNFILNEGIIIS